MVGPDTHNISLFADDIIVYITIPESSLSHLNSLLKLYSSFSGYKVNLVKSEILMLSACVSLQIFGYFCGKTTLKISTKSI